MELEEFKEVLREYWDVCNTNNEQAIMEFTRERIIPILHPDFEYILPAYRSQRIMKGIDALKHVTLENIRSFPDLQYESLELFGENDKLCYVGSFTGTHKGEIFGIKPTGKTISGEYMQTYTFVDNKLKSIRLINDSLPLFQQIGQAVFQQDEAKEIETYMTTLRQMGLIPE
ncbi:MAG: ester cyclase [Candidatus Kariarchaeaceae archaeon]|jgi:predicted ester cyclase